MIFYKDKGRLNSCIRAALVQLVDKSVAYGMDVRGGIYLGVGGVIDDGIVLPVVGLQAQTQQQKFHARDYRKKLERVGERPGIPVWPRKP